MSIFTKYIRIKMVLAWNLLRLVYILSIVLLIVHLPIQYIPIPICLVLIGFITEIILTIVTKMLDEVMRL